MIDDSWYRRPPGVAEHVAAGGIIVRVDDGRLYVALIREAGPPGYVLPKGHVVPNESLEEAARREIAEESGLTDLTLVGELGLRERLDYEKQSWKKTHYFLFVTRQSTGSPTDPGHHPELVRWFALEALPTMFWPEQRELLEVNRTRIGELLRAKRVNPPGGER